MFLPLLVYVDDIVLTCINITKNNTIKPFLHNKFNIKNLDPFVTFLTLKWLDHHKVYSLINVIPHLNYLETHVCWPLNHPLHLISIRLNYIALILTASMTLHNIVPSLVN